MKTRYHIIRFVITMLSAAITVTGMVSCSADRSFDFYTEASVCIGQYNGPIGEHGSHNYFICLSDKGFSPDSTYIPEAAYYYFDIFSDIPADSSSISIPEGQYILGKRNGSISGTFTPNYSITVECTENGKSTQMPLSKGVLHVYRKDGRHIIKAELTDAAGMTHCINYTGPALLADRSGKVLTEFSPLTGNLDINATSCAISSSEGPAGNSNVTLSLTDMETDGKGLALPPGSIVNIDVFMPVPSESRLVPGTYNLTPAWGHDFTVSPGELQDGNYFVGTTVEHYDGEKGYIGFMEKGTVSIAYDDITGNHTISFELTSSNGHVITGSYTGNSFILHKSSTDAGYSRTFQRPVYTPTAHSGFTVRSL